MTSDTTHTSTHTHTGTHTCSAGLSTISDVNGLTEGLEPNLNLFVGDTKTMVEIHSTQDCENLKSDLQAPTLVIQMADEIKLN